MVGIKAYSIGTTQERTGMNREELYTAPSAEIFEGVKAASIKLWQTYDNQHGYVDEKVSRIEKIINFKDNTTFIVAMFDSSNQNKLLGMVEGEAKVWLEDLLHNNQT